MSVPRFVELLTAELPDYQVTYQHDQSDAELIKAIHGQLKQGLPVPIFLGAENAFNKPHYDFHASVVTGLDLANGKVDIANVYGYEEHISLVRAASSSELAASVLGGAPVSRRVSSIPPGRLITWG